MPNTVMWAQSHPGLSPRHTRPEKAAGRPEQLRNHRESAGALASRTGKTVRDNGPSRLGPVINQGFEGAVLLVIALYASMALLNAGDTWAAVLAQWQSFIDFLSSGLMG